MSDIVCPVTELSPPMCAHCRKLASPEEEIANIRRQLLATGLWFAAQYPGRCARCAEVFFAGAAICIDLLDGPGWRGECCAEESEHAQ